MLEVFEEIIYNLTDGEGTMQSTHRDLVREIADHFAALKQRCQVAYPETLRRNIIALNHPVLRGNLRHKLYEF